MINFAKTLEKIDFYKAGIDDLDSTWLAADMMAATARKVLSGILKPFDETFKDDISASFVSWTRARGLLVLA